MRKTLLLVLAAALPVVATTVHPPAAAAVPTSTLTPQPVDGSRGDLVTLAVRLMTDGEPRPGQRVTFEWRSDATDWRWIGEAKSGLRGWARWEDFRIPTNPAHDNVRIRARFTDPDVLGIFLTAEAIWRISIHP